MTLGDTTLVNVLKNGFASLIGATVQFMTVDALKPVAIAKGTHTTERLTMENRNTVSQHIQYGTTEKYRDG